MITAEITKKEFSPDGVRVSITYRGDGIEFSEQRVVRNIEDVYTRVRAKIAQVDASSVSSLTIPTGVINVPAEAVPTAEEAALNDWLNGTEKLKRIQQLVTLGIFTGTETPIMNLRNKLRADFKVEYLAAI